MKFKVTPDLWIVGALFLFTFGVAYISSLQQPVCVDADANPGLWDLTAWPIKVAFFQLIAAFGLFAFSLSRRFVAITPLAEPARVQGEYVSSMGRLLQKAGQKSLIAETLARQFQQELARKAGLPVSASQSEILTAIKISHPVIAKRAQAIFDQAVAFKNVAEKADVMGMIRWGREIAAIRQEWRRGH